MKRIIAYITVTLSLLLATLVGLVPSLKAVNGTGDYTAGRQYVYKISNKNYNIINNSGTTDEIIGSDEQKQEILDDVVDEFKIRLANADITDYKLETSGFDTIKVTFKTATTLYSQISDYLNFSWSFKASNYKGDTFVGQDATQVADGSGTDNFFDKGSARIEYKDNYPYVVVKLKDPDAFHTLFTVARDATEESTSSLNEVTPLDDSSDTEEETTPNINKIYVLNDWLTGMDIETLLSTDGSPYMNKNLTKNHILFEYDATKPESIFWDYDSSLTGDDQKNKVYEEIYFGGYNLLTDTTYYGNTESDRVNAYKMATIWMNRFNAETYDYAVTLLNINGTNAYTSVIQPFIDYLVFMTDINWGNSLFIASLIAIVVVSLFLILHYGINGFTTILTSFGLLITSIGLFNTFGSEFNVGAILGLIALMFVSIFTSTIYFKKVQNEVYAGKNLKKANQEGSKKSFIIQLDISIITMILGITAYLIPTSNLISFGSLLIVGSILNILLNGALLRALSWLVYNSSLINKKMNLIAINSKLIPDLSKDEKPTYFDQYNKKEPKHQYKVVGIVSSILLVASIIGLTTFGLTRGNIFNFVSTQSSTEIVIRVDELNVTEDNTTLIEDNIDYLNTIFEQQIFKDSEKKNSISKDVEVKTYNFSYIVDSVTNKEYYYVVDLKNIVDTDSTVYALNNDSVLQEMTFEQAVNIKINDVMTTSNISVNSIYNENNDSNNYYILLFASIGIAVTSIYMLLRFNLSKMLTSLLIIGSIQTIMVGIFSLMNAPFNSVITLGVLLLTLLGYIVMDIYFCTEKEIYADKKRELIDIDSRKDPYEVGFNTYYPYICGTAFISSLIIISMFFTTSLDFYLLILVLLGVVATLIITKALSINIELFFSKIFRKISNALGKIGSNKKEKSNKKQTKDGPEEAIFIGIND